MSDCIFCKIIANEIPSKKIFEDDRVVVILDHRPVRTGHAMVIPKRHVDEFIDLPDDLAAHICIIANEVGRKIQETLNPARVGFAVAGFGVAHAHYHVVPMHRIHDVTSSVYAKGDVEFGVEHIPLADPESQDEIVRLLRF